MQQNIFLRRDGNLSSHDVNFDEIIEEKKVNEQSVEWTVLTSRWKILFIDSSLNALLPQCPFAFISPLRSTLCFSFDLMLWKISF